MRLLVFVLLLNFNCAFSQKDTIKYRPKNVIYGELGGSSIFLGIGYERLVSSKKNNFLSLKVGVGNAFFINNINLGVSYFVDVDIKKLFLEVKSSLIIAEVTPLNEKKWVGLFFQPGLGVRIFPITKSGVSFGLNFCPFLFFDSTKVKRNRFILIPFIGLSLGYAF